MSRKCIYSNGGGYTIREMSNSTNDSRCQNAYNDHLKDPYNNYYREFSGDNRPAIQEFHHWKNSRGHQPHYPSYPSYPVYPPSYPPHYPRSHGGGTTVCLDHQEYDFGLNACVTIPHNRHRTPYHQAPSYSPIPRHQSNQYHFFFDGQFHSGPLTLGSHNRVLLDGRPLYNFRVNEMDHVRPGTPYVILQHHTGTIAIFPSDQHGRRISDQPVAVQGRRTSSLEQDNKTPQLALEVTDVDEAPSSPTASPVTGMAQSRGLRQQG